MRVYIEEDCFCGDSYVDRKQKTIVNDVTEFSIQTDCVDCRMTWSHSDGRVGGGKFDAGCFITIVQ